MNIINETYVPIGRMLALKGALKLEIKGMRNRGRSAYAIIKGNYGLRGSREKVLADFNKIIEETRNRLYVPTN